MLVEIVLAAGLTAVGALAARAWVGRRAEPARRTDGRDPAERAELRVGDVLVDRASDRSHWLAGVLELDEEGRTRKLFRAVDDVARVTWIAELTPGEDLLLLGSTDAVSEGRVPDELRLDARRFTLRWRGRVRVRTRGEHLPATTPQAEVCWLAALGGGAVLVLDFEQGERLSLSGEAIDRARFDFLPAT